MSFYTEFAPFYDQIFPFREDVYHFLREYAGEPGGALLDAGCGPGIYCGRFMQEGFRTTGIDLDSAMIAAANAAFPSASFYCMDITAIEDLPNSFQLIYSVGNVLAHLSGPQRQRFQASVYDKLDTGGVWAFQVVNLDYLVTLQEYTFPVKRIGGGSMEFYRHYSLISPEQATFEVELISEGKKLFHEVSRLYPVGMDACLAQHTAAGFSIEGVYGGFDNQPFSKERNAALVMVFRKA